MREGSLLDEGFYKAGDMLNLSYAEKLLRYCENAIYYLRIWNPRPA